MAWPETELEARYEIQAGGSWIDITDDVRVGAGATISRGRPDEATVADPGSCEFELNNGVSNCAPGVVGRYSPRNPNSDLYGLIGRNTPVRVSVRGPETYLAIPPEPSTAVAASSPVPTPIGALDVRVELALDRLPGQLPATGTTPFLPEWTEIIGQYAHQTNQRSWYVSVNAVGGVSVRWSTDGTSAPGSLLTGQVVADALPYASGQRFALRAALSVDGGTWMLIAYHAPTMAGPWTSLGQVTGSGAGPYSTTIPMLIGWPVGVTARGAGRYYRAEVRDAAGTLAAPNFTTAAPGGASLTDPQGNTWTPGGDSRFTDLYRRFVGEISSWPPRWDVSEADAWVPVQAAGVLRRIQQGAKALDSTLRRRIPSFAPLAYWPMEEQRGATQAYSPIAGVQPMVTSGMDWGSDDTLPGSAPLPRLTDASTFQGTVPAAPAGAWRVELAYYIAAAPADDATWLEVRTTGTYPTLRVRLEDGGVLSVWGSGETDSVRLLYVTTAGFGFYDGWRRLYLWSRTDGGTVSLRVGWYAVGGTAVGVTTTYAGSSGRVASIGGRPSASLTGATMGHVAVWPSPADDGGFADADDGFTGDSATGRMRRLATEERLTCATSAAVGTTQVMGPQRPATLLDLLGECADADGGVLMELRDVAGLAYRPRVALYNQTPALQLDYAAGHIAPGLEPQDDDQLVRNDITVSRPSGSSARAVLEYGPLSVQPPPDGVGRYDESTTVNVATDSQLDGIAWWRLHLATVDEVRYPTVRLNLRSPHIQGHLQDYLDRLDVGARITIANPPPWVPPGAIDLIVQSYSETIGQYEWAVELTCTPASPWTVGALPTDAAPPPDAPVRVDTDGALLVGDLGPADTVLPVLTTAGPEWVTTAGPAPTAAPGDLPADITVGGETMRVSGIEPFLWDDFSRTVTGGWGTAPCATSADWALSGGDPEDRSVSSSAAAVTLPQMNTPAFQLLSTWQVPDVDVVCSLSPSAVAAGAPILAGLALRVSGSSWYWPRLVLTTAGTVGIEIADGLAPVTSLVATGLPYSAGTRIWMRARVFGATVQARCWLDGGAEPVTRWHVTWTGATAVASGRVGLVAMTTTGSSLTNPSIAFRSFQTATPQRFDVTRAINGVSKPHSVGGMLRLAHPMTVAL